MGKLNLKKKINSEAENPDQLQAIEAIEEIADAVLTAEGLHEGDEPTEDQIDYVLDTVSELTMDPEAQEPLEDVDIQEDFEEEFPDENFMPADEESLEDTSASVKKVKFTCYKSKKVPTALNSDYEPTEEGGILLITDPSVIDVIKESFEELADQDKECEDGVCKELVVTDSPDLSDSEEVVYGLTMSSVKKAATQVSRKYYKLASKLNPNAKFLGKLVSSLLLQKKLASAFDNLQKVASGLTAEQLKNKIVSEFIETTQETIGGAEVKKDPIPMETDAVDSPNGPVENNDFVPDEDVPTVDEALNDDIPKSYAFDDIENIEVIEIPISGLDDTNVLELQVLNSRVSVIKQAYVNPGVGNRSGYYEGAAARKILSNKELVPCRTPYLDGRVINIKSKNTGCIFSQSSVLGLVAVKAPIVKGIKNTRYSIFSRKNGKLCDKFGNTITSSVNLVIASAVSNRSAAKAEPMDFVGSIESAYINHIKSKAEVSQKRIQLLASRLKAQENQSDEIIRCLSNGILRQHKKHQDYVKSSVSDLDAIRSQAYKAEQDRLFKSNVEIVNRENRRAAEINKQNVDILTKMFR